MSKNAFRVFIAFVIIICLLVAGWGIGYKITGNYNPIEWTQSSVQPDTPTDKDKDNENKDNENKEPETPTGAVEKHNGSFVVTTYSTDESLISLCSEVVQSSSAEGGFTLTATVYPEDADNQTVNWLVEWDNPDADFASGNCVDDFVTITPITEDGLTVSANCSAAFGEKIKITVTSEDNPQATAICVCDYVKRITGLIFTAGELFFPSTGYSYTVETSDYTLDSNVAIEVGNKMTLTEDFIDEIVNKYSNSTYQYNVDWSFNADKYAFISTDYNAKQITFAAADKNFASCFTYPDDEYSSDEIAEMMSYINSAFRSAVNSYSGIHATFSVAYTSTYNGTIYTSGEKTIECRFNYSSLKVPVGSLTLSSGSIIF